MPHVSKGYSAHRQTLAQVLLHPTLSGLRHKAIVKVWVEIYPAENQLGEGNNNIVYQFRLNSHDIRYLLKSCLVPFVSFMYHKHILAGISMLDCFTFKCHSSWNRLLQRKAKFSELQGCLNITVLFFFLQFQTWKKICYFYSVISVSAGEHLLRFFTISVVVHMILYSNGSCLSYIFSWQVPKVWNWHVYSLPLTTDRFAFLQLRLKSFALLNHLQGHHLQSRWRVSPTQRKT